MNSYDRYLPIEVRPVDQWSNDQLGRYLTNYICILHDTVSIRGSANEGREGIENLEEEKFMELGNIKERTSTKIAEESPSH